MKPFGSLAPLLMAAAVILPVTSQAREYLGFGQEGDPGSLSFQNYAQFNHSSPSSNSIENYFELSYFTNTGFTGTTRDQWEFWIGFNGGYASTHGATGSSGFGITAPGLGAEYYLDVIQPTVAVGKPGYFTFWTSPYADVNFPNGDTQSSGFGAGADQFSFDVGVDNFIQAGNIAITVNPVTVHYAAGNLNTVADATIPGATRKDRGGLSFTFADGGIGYQLTPNWLVGVMHQFNVNNISGSTFKSSREGFGGPAFTYAGFASRGLFISGTVETDYYNQGLSHQTYVAAWLSKEF